MVVPSALRVTRLRPGRDFTVLGQICHEVGWKHRELVDRLEKARKVASGAYYLKKKESNKRLAAAIKAVGTA